MQKEEMFEFRNAVRKMRIVREHKSHKADCLKMIDFIDKLLALGYDYIDIEINDCLTNFNCPRCYVRGKRVNRFSDYDLEKWRKHAS